MPPSGADSAPPAPSPSARPADLLGGLMPAGGGQSAQVDQQKVAMDAQLSELSRQLDGLAAQFPDAADALQAAQAALMEARVRIITSIGATSGAPQAPPLTSA